MKPVMKPVWIAASVALLAGPAAAQNSTCGTANPMGVDDARVFTLDEGTANAERWFVFEAHDTRSYCVETHAAGDEMDSSWDTELELFADDCVTSLGASDDDVRDPVLSPGSRVCFVAAASADVVARVLQAADPVDWPQQSFVLRVTETTLFSPYFQVVSSAAYDAAPQIKNNTGAPISVAFTTYNTAGVPTGCVETPFTIPANGMATFAISSQCGISTGFGAAQVAHDGPPGAVSANITTFSGASGLSFDAEFEVREKNAPAR